MTGENHPELALIDSNIGLILHAVGEYDISLRFLEKALALNIAYHGPRLLPLLVLVLFAKTVSNLLSQKPEGCCELPSGGQDPELHGGLQVCVDQREGDLHHLQDPAR